MKIRRRGRRTPAQNLATPKWAGTDALKIGRRLNCRALKSIVASIAGLAGPTGIPAVERNAADWARMNEPAIKKAAGNPVLLLQLHFRNADWWQWVLQGGPKPLRTAADDMHLELADGQPLIRDILTEGCVMVRSNPEGAKILFGMSSAVLGLFAGLTGSDIELIAMKHSGELQLRWPDNRVFWRNLLRAALSGSEEELAPVHMHSLQLLGNLERNEAN